MFKPTLLVSRLKDDGHAVVELSHPIRGVSGDYGESLQRIASLFVCPRVQETSKVGQLF